VLLSLLGFPETVPTHDGDGNQLTPEEYKDLAIKMERMYWKCKGKPHTKEAGWAVLEAIQWTCKEFRSLKVRRDGFVGLGPLFRSVKKRARFYEYVEEGSGAILPNIVSPFRVWYELWLAGIPVKEARLSALGKGASGLAIAPAQSQASIPQAGGSGLGRGKSVASASTVASHMWAVATDSAKGPTGKCKAVASSVIGGWPSLAPPAPGQITLWKQPGSALPTPVSGGKNLHPAPVSTLAATPRSFVTRISGV
jgi:hypothetical protein